jgi:hypothetical protein
MPKVKITTIRKRIKHLIVDEFVELYYEPSRQLREPNITQGELKKAILHEIEPHIKAIHEVLETPRLNISED